MPRILKVFLDTSALLAGLNSPQGAAGVILAACFSRTITPLISSQVMQEADANIPAKFPDLLPAFQSFLLIPPKVVKDPTIQQVQNAYWIIQTNDAPILAAAIKAKPDVLITWNTRHFLIKRVRESVSFPILTPGDFLNQYLKP